MKHEVGLRVVPGRYIAAVRERRRRQELGAKLIPLLDRVYVAVREGKVAQTGHNIFIFRDATRDEVTVEIGVEVAAPFEPFNGIVCATTPAGEVARALHRGPYSELGHAYEAILRWCSQNQRPHANVWWEIYGDWQEDPTKLETEIFYALQPKER